MFYWFRPNLFVHFSFSLFAPLLPCGFHFPLVCASVENVYAILQWFDTIAFVLPLERVWDCVLLFPRRPSKSNLPVSLNFSCTLHSLTDTYFFSSLTDKLLSPSGTLAKLFPSPEILFSCSSQDSWKSFRSQLLGQLP